METRFIYLSNANLFVKNKEIEIINNFEINKNEFINKFHKNIKNTNTYRIKL